MRLKQAAQSQTLMVRSAATPRISNHEASFAVRHVKLEAATPALEQLAPLLLVSKASGRRQPYPSNQ
jgi:hypothetical protein